MPDAVAGSDAVVVSHLSLDEEPPSGLVNVIEPVASNQYPVAVVVKVGE